MPVRFKLLMGLHVLRLEQHNATENGLATTTSPNVCASPIGPNPLPMGSYMCGGFGKGSNLCGLIIKSKLNKAALGRIISMEGEI